MSTQVETKSLRERIAEALAESQRSDAESEAQRVSEHQRMLTKLIREVLEVEDELTFTLNGCRVEAEVEGLRFCFHSSDYGRRLMLVVECPHCHERNDLYAGTLDGLARSIERGLGESHKSGKCVAASTSPTSQTTEERLLQALRDFISENSYQPE